MRKKNLSGMKLLVRLVLVWTAVGLSKCQCVLEKEYFCSSVPNNFPEGLTSILFVVTNLGVLNSTVFNSPSLESVTSLALANSGITKIEPGAFHAFRSLTKLSLYRNGLTDVMASWLFDPGRLENLTASHNLISAIGPNMFSSFTNLTTLNLANNRIHGIASGSFQGLPKLTSIDLSGNNFTTLTRSVFDGLQRPVMKLGSSPWNCSCELQDFGVFLQELVNASLLEDASSVICRNPPSLEGIPVWNISDLNCSEDPLSSQFEADFHKVGLPALLTCLGFVSFILLLCLIWRMKPRQEAPVLPTSMKPSSQVNFPMGTCQQPDQKGRSANSGKGLQTGGLRVRAKSAFAILLQTESHQGKRQVTSLVGVNQEQLTAPHLTFIDQPCVGSGGWPNCMESWYYKLREGSKVDLQNHSANFYLAEVRTEMPGVEVSSAAAKQILQDNETSGGPDDDKGHNGAGNSEPFLYLSVTTATEEPRDAPCKKEAIANMGGSHLDSLRRALTWPYERNTRGQESVLLHVRDSFITQFFRPVANIGEDVGQWELDKDLHLRQEDHGCYGSSELNKEAKVAKDVESPHMEESVVSVPVDVRKSELEEEWQRQCDLCLCARKDHQALEGRTELNAETKPSNPAELPKESKVTGAVRGIQNSQPTTEAVKCPPSEKNKQLSKPVSSRSRIHPEIHPSPLLSGDTSPTGSPCDDVLLENNAYNYINLLHEVVENRGRWTRERWKQTHRKHSVHPTNSQ